MRFNRVCVINSSYSLFLYFLLSSEKEITETYYFWWNGIPKQVRDYFSNQSYYHFEPSRFGKLYRILNYHFIFPIRWPFLCKKEISIWGHDHLPFSSSVIRNHKINIIEDGIRNYNGIKAFNKKNPHLYSFLYGKTILSREFCYMNDWCNAEYLTGIIPDSPCMNSNKAKIISIKKLWEESTLVKQKIILQIFGISSEDLKNLKSKHNILLTQPFSEDNVLSESEKIQIYKNKIKEIGITDLIIKPHPRETTDYQKYFPAIPIFNKKVPMELLLLCGVRFDNAYTINSTAIYDFPKETKLTMWGESINEKIELFFKRVRT